MNYYEHTVFIPVTALPRQQYGIIHKRLLLAELALLAPKRKTRQLDMLLSIPDNHPNKDELEKLVREEFKVNLLERSSGNGSFDTEWNPDGLFYADANETSEHSKYGLAELLTDDKTVSYYDNEAQTMVDISISNYSIWDTIYLKGQLIVNRSGHWQKGVFDKAGYKEREARRMKLKHKRLLGLTGTFEKDKTSGYEARKQKRLERLQARTLNKIGYNAYA